MTRFLVGVIAISTLLAFGPAGVVGQQKIDRFAAQPSSGVSVSLPDQATFEERSTYWLEGAVIGLVAGVVTALIVVDPTDACPLQPGAQCSENPAYLIIGSVLLGTGGAFLGGMIGASVPRATGHGT